MMMVTGVSLVLLGFGYLMGLVWWSEGHRSSPPISRSLMFWLVAPGFGALAVGIGLVFLSLAVLSWRYLP